MKVTAKFVVTSRQQTEPTWEGQPITITLQPDYADGRNKEWAAATPSGSIMLNIDPTKTAAADLFKSSAPILVTFEAAE